VSINQDHQIIGKTRVLNGGVFAVPRDLLRLFQHLVYLVEINVAEQRRNDPTLRHAASAGGFQHHLQQVHYICIVDPLCHLSQQPIVPDIVKVAAQIDVDYARLLLNNRLGHPVDRVMSRPFWTISERSRLEVCLKDWFQYELERTLHHPIPNGRNGQDADFTPILRYLLPPSRQRHILAPNEFVLYLSEESIYALFFDGLEG